MRSKSAAQTWHFQVPVRVQQLQPLAHPVRYEPPPAFWAFRWKPSHCNSRDSDLPEYKRTCHSTASPAGPAKKRPCSPQIAEAVQSQLSPSGIVSCLSSSFTSVKASDCNVNTIMSLLVHW